MDATPETPRDRQQSGDIIDAVTRRTIRNRADRMLDDADIVHENLEMIEAQRRQHRLLDLEGNGTVGPTRGGLTHPSGGESHLGP